MAQSTNITGKVEYREGDGANIVIRPGRVDIETIALDATLSWVDEKRHGTAAMPIGDLRSYVASGAIVLDVDTACP